MQRRDERDGRDEQQERPRVADVQPLRDQVACSSPERKREQDSEPVEAFALRRVNRVNRERPFAREPHREHDREHDAEDRRRRDERNPVVVGEVVSDLRPDDADQDDAGPVDPRDVPPRTELENERGEQKRRRDERRLRQAEPDVVGEVVGSGLADGRAQHLDHPEVEGDLRDLVQHPAQGRATNARRHRRTVPAST